MNKILLSVATLAAIFSTNAQGISSQAAFDDFKNTSPYSVETEKLAWDYEKDAPGTSKAYKGIYFWTDQTPSSGLDYTAARAGDGKLVFTITKPYGNYDAMGLGWGGYAMSAEATKPTEFTMDLSGNANFSITMSKEDTAIIGVLFQLKDSAGASLYIDKAVALDPKPADNAYKYQLGYSGGAYAEAAAPLGSDGIETTFTYDFKNALPGSYPAFAADNSGFDFKKVTSLLIFVSNTHQNAADGYKPYGLNNAKVTISSFKLGDVVTYVADKSVVDTFGDEVVTVYNLQGAVVAQGKVDEISLGAGFYIYKTAKMTQKVVIK